MKYLMMILATLALGACANKKADFSGYQGKNISEAISAFGQPTHQSGNTYTWDNTSNSNPGTVGQPAACILHMTTNNADVVVSIVDNGAC